MDEFQETIFRLDAAAQYQELVDYAVKNEQSTEHALFVTYQLFVGGRFQSAYILSKLLMPRSQHPLVFLSIGVGGLLFGNAADEAAGAAALRAVVDTLNPDQRQSLYKDIIYPPSLALINQVVGAGEDSRMLRFLELMKAGAPILQEIFDFSAAVPDINVYDMRGRGRRRGRLLEFRSPPASAPRKPRRAIIAMRNLVFPADPASRTFDGGPRITAAMNAYGWRATHFKMEWSPLLLDYQNLAAFCREERADVLVLDDHLIEYEEARGPRRNMIRELREHLPTLKIVAMHLDPWALASKILIEESADLDVVWAIAPTMPVWQHPVFADKMFQAPLPHAGNFGQPGAPLPSRMSFLGGIKGYNWHRAFWKAAAERYKLPIEWRISDHKMDGLDTLESYAQYIRRLGKTGMCLNFSMRPNLARVIASRAFETINSGALLIEEEALDLDCYLIAGEHYLEFSTFADLRALVRFVTERREEAEAIRCAGNEYFLSKFSDDKIVGYLDHQLFHRADRRVNEPLLAAAK